jgi:peptide chain release factor
MILLQISANTGPEECCLAVRKALQVLLRECADAGVNVEVLEEVRSDQPGNLRSVLLALDDQAAAGVALRQPLPDRAQAQKLVHWPGSF